ncbi:MAG: 50S ribosomal protein L24 [Candidatus Omnitrophica bacterium]|nr:50S ribosomal protein L24 [Candidatus Omnitrophota bacterium]
MARVKKGDTVEVIAGKDKGKRGKVIRVYPSGNRVLVQGVNIVKRHMRQRRQDVPGGIIEMETPLHISNVMPVCNRCGRGVRVGFKILEDGSKIRICKKCGETI